ncbi:pyridoxal phosphate homeostasis protein-like isoform X2 [Gordionus sp. m RMFG-2023]|uniref:pyridoxal phosphate homeostasis protein-like isoform X2 n=1 Tax=Gordionus sp. m RMFG-2023 TaxID=3053472 RepID=UPI0031FC46EF
MSEISVKLKEVLFRFHSAVKSSKILHGPIPKMIAASKTKPVEDIIEAYKCGQRDFGENYILNDCKEIKWHFIGHLQKNKVNKLISVPNLYMIQTIHSQALASQVNNALSKLSTKMSGDNKLKILIQVNTSGEQEKNGLDPDKVSPLVKFIMAECLNLQFKGLMTIGMLDASQHGHTIDNPNPDFLTLIKCREDVSRECGLKIEDMELSMGMSQDFEHAIEMGATYVRIGTIIFGERNYSLMVNES